MSIGSVFGNFIVIIGLAILLYGLVKNHQSHTK
jgi:Ca2+/Na+ antiporter